MWCSTVDGLLYPSESETRQTISLDGLWSFRLDEQGVGETERWFALTNLPQPRIPMPVPASFNDVTQNVTIHQYIGWVWYARDFFVQQTTSRWVLRFQSTNYETRVWVNGQSALNHSGGHLPFEANISPFLFNNATAAKMRIVVAINNTLTATTLPPAELQIVNPTYRYLETAFDSFNYAGIDRSVLLYSTSSIFIQDITIDTQSIDFDVQHIATSAILTYSVTIGDTSREDSIRILVELVDADGIVVVNGSKLQSQLIVNKPHLWEPCGMNHTHPCTEQSYLYTLKVTLYSDETQRTVLDVYRIDHVGIRTIRWTQSQFLVNERAFYFHGGNTNEDSDIRGRGYDQVALSKLFNLHGWFHGNAFRTAPYPLADEFYIMADRYGIAIIDEVPAIGMRDPKYFSDITLNHHKQTILDMISRDRNHPSVFMWSLANEPASGLSVAEDYFSTLANFTRPIAAGRPITLMINEDSSTDRAAHFYDIVCINRYFGWYTENGRLDQVTPLVLQELEKWRRKHPTKPIMIIEYGAEAIPGLHNDPSVMFTEEYQKDVFAAYHPAFDHVSSLIHPDDGFFIGELVFTTMDFATEQNIKRVSGLNHKGIFTRQRQPKAGAFVIKNRYEQLEQIQTIHTI